ncbi:hypothetical protein FRC14_003813 [Serendipita sp. 396]|nr:hypothetical protein FRC14_003813 [Serendipita sp. 396]KAG8780811.1 hypothetical protein FRC15_009264 [Serendipita sp. 397]KAG8867536.1 hypothetical protein FRC20_005505 [Serendipita sp. 405]
MGDESNVVASPLPSVTGTNTPELVEGTSTPGLTGDSSTPSLPRSARSRKQVDHHASMLLSPEAIADEQRRRDKTSSKGNTPARTPLNVPDAEHVPVFGTGTETLEDAVKNDKARASLLTSLAQIKKCEKEVNEQIITLFKDFREATEGDVDDSEPGETGITDKLRILIHKGKAGSMQKLTQEDIHGADGLFALRIVETDGATPASAGASQSRPGTASGSTSPNGRKEWLVFFQAKVEKRAPLQTDPTGMMIDFMYQSGSGDDGELQMHLLERKVNEERAKHKSSVRVFGGYLIYTSNGVVFIPLPEVLKYTKGDNLAKAKGKRTDTNRRMTKELMAIHGKDTLFLTSILDYDHLNINRLTSQLATHATISGAGAGTGATTPART